METTITEVNNKEIQEIFEKGINNLRHKWSLVERGPEKGTSMDLINHVLRAIIQADQVEKYEDEFDQLLSCQFENGAWSDNSTTTHSGVRNTCFSARNLIRANRILHKDAYHQAVVKAAHYILGRQEPEGFWDDKKWSKFDATSSSMGFMLYVIKYDLGSETEQIHKQAHEALERAANYLRENQLSDGSWTEDHDKIEAVGHLLPKLILFEGESISDQARKGIDFLISNQMPDGSWDDSNTDSVCDAVRALILIYGVTKIDELNSVINNGLNWLQNNKNNEGLWGIYPGKGTNLLITCDVLDCFAKYQAHMGLKDIKDFWQ